MTLYLIGIGLFDEKDISIRGLEIIKKSDIIYLEHYTSSLQCPKENLEKLYQKKIELAPRNIAEQGAKKIINEAKTKDVAFLVIGDPMAATTHIELFRSAKEKNINVKIIHNSSIFTAIGTVGLQLYKYGRTISIPFLERVPQLESPYIVIKENLEKGLHTLLLLDIWSEKEKFMTINEAIEILEKLEKKFNEKIIHDDLLIVGCARLGSPNPTIISGKLKDLKNKDFGKPLHSLIIPGKMHFLEKEMLNFWSTEN